MCARLKAIASLDLETGRFPVGDELRVVVCRKVWYWRSKTGLDLRQDEICYQGSFQRCGRG